jgi:hypothetical protein
MALRRERHGHHGNRFHCVNRHTAHTTALVQVRLREPRSIWQKKHRKKLTYTFPTAKKKGFQKNIWQKINVKTNVPVSYENKKVSEKYIRQKNKQRTRLMPRLV